MLHTFGKFILIAFSLAVLFQARSLYSKDAELQLIDVFKLSRYDEDRIAYQQFEKQYDQYHVDTEDNSIAALMIIKDKKIYLLKDGYDNPEQIRNKILMYTNGNKLCPDLWENKISGNPNFLLVADRKVELQKNTSKEWVSSNYKDFYIKIRDEFLKKHVSIFLSLIINRKDTEMNVSRKEIPKRISDQGPSKYAISVTARTVDGGTVYYAEDADGDGITETFMVNTTDGFSWGYRSGANTIFIKNNTQKDIEKIIGKITNTAHHGSPEEQQIIKKTFPAPDKISTMINDIYRIDPDTNKYLKDNKINIEEITEKGSKAEK